MSNLLLDLINYVTNKELIQGDGVDAFRDFMPEEPDNVVVFNEYRGDPLLLHETITNRSVQVVTRNKDAEAACSLANEICKCLQPTTDNALVQISEERWGQIYVRQSPFKLGQDDNDRVLYCFNIGVTTALD